MTEYEKFEKSLAEARKNLGDDEVLEIILDIEGFKEALSETIFQTGIFNCGGYKNPTVVELTEEERIAACRAFYYAQQFIYSDPNASIYPYMDEVANKLGLRNFRRRQI